MPRHTVYTSSFSNMIRDPEYIVHVTPGHSIQAFHFPPPVQTETSTDTTTHTLVLTIRPVYAILLPTVCIYARCDETRKPIL